MSKIGDMFISLGIEPTGDLKNAEKTVRKLSTAASIFEQRLDRLGKTNPFAGIADAADDLNKSLVVGARAAHSNVKQIKALTEAHKDLRDAANDARNAVSSRGNVFRGPFPIRGGQDMARAVGVRGGIGAIAGSAALDAQRAANAQAWAKSLAQDARRMSVSGASPAPGLPSGGRSTAIQALASGTFDADGLLRRKVTDARAQDGTPYSNEAHFDSIIAGLGPPQEGGGSFGVMGKQAPRPGLWQRTKARWNNARGGGGGRGRGGGGGFGGGGGGSRFGALGTASSLNRMVMGLGAYQGIQGFGQMADTYAQLQMRLNGLTQSQEKTNQVFGRLRTIAQNTNTGLEDTTESYVRLTYATENMKLSEEDRFKLMENINTMVATSGASTMEASSAVRQLTQAFSKGKLDGDEFRSMAENMPNMLKVLAKSLNTTEGNLRRMSKAGELTREKLVKAFLEVKGLQKPVATFGNTWQKFKDNLIVAFGEMSKNEKFVESFAEMLVYAKDALLEIVKVLPYVFRAVRTIIKAFADWVKALQAGELWAKGIAVAIGTLMLPSLFRLLAFPFVRLIAFFKDLGKAWAFAGAMGRFFAGSSAAAGAGGAGAAAAGAAGASGGGMLGKIVAGAATVGSRFIPPLAAALIANEASGGSLNDAGVAALAEGQGVAGAFAAHRESRVSQGQAVWDQIDAYRGYSSGFGTPQGQIMPQGGSVVNMGGITINVEAQDGTDFGSKAMAALEKEMRHAGATVNR